MALNETQVAATELERVEPKVTTLFERDSVFYANVEKRPVEVISNRDMRIPLELKPGGNFGHYDPAGGDLGRGDGPTFDKAVINTVHFKFGVEWQKKAEWATDDRRKAVLDAFRHLMAKSMSEFRRQVDSVCMTAGNGVVGTVSGVNNQTLTLGSDGFGTRLLRYGQRINIYNAGLTVNRTAGDERTLTAVDPVAKTITYSGGVVAGPVVATDKIVLSGLSGASPTSLLGVPYHHNSASSGNWLGLDRAANPEVRANSVNAAGSLALPFARLAVNKIGERIGIDNSVKMDAWMHPCQVQAYEELGQLYMSIIKGPGKEKFDPYFSDNLQIAGIPIRKSFSWDKTRIDFVVNEAWGRAEFHPPGFYTESGRKIFELRGASGGVAAASIFYIVASFNLFVNNPPACSYIYGLTVPSGY